MRVAGESFCDLIIGSNFRLLRAFYLSELHLLQRGIPYGALRIAGSMREKSLELMLFQIASRDEFARWNKFYMEQVTGKKEVTRNYLLKLADEAKIQNRFRKATQLYGIGMLTSTERDNVFEWSVHHLLDISNTHFKER